MAKGAKRPLSYQPLRLLFQISYIATIILRLPYYVIVALVPFLRPNRKWNAKQTFMTHLVCPFLDLRSRVGITEALTLEPGKEGERFQIVPPADPNAYKGPLVSDTVKPATIGGTWFPRAPGPYLAGKTIALYFHGGAFVQGDGRDARCGPVAERLLKQGCADAVFSVQYRLSGYGDANPFPAALQDALSSYLFLLNEVCVPARQVVVGGDSAGGNLTVALLRYLREFGPGIPTPRCAVVFSPWVAPFEYDFSDNPQRGTDYIPTSFPRWGAHAYAGSRGPDVAAHPYVTPLSNPFPTPVPVFASVGSAELLYQRVKRWAAEMSGVEGNTAVMYHELDAVHDTFLVAEMLGFERSAWDVAAKAGEFVRSC
ncbi:alpha/beta hydrolase fold-3 domain-containing protein [Xylaria palmicola]|nr:alpha/beta hydrolase fold-3 domain-containing protein [Xylaria palmicola]